MGNFQYEYYLIDIRYDIGKMTTEFKGKSKEHVIKQIQKEFNFTNSEKNLSQPCWKRQNQMKEIFWDTLRLDRTGYSRRF